MLPRLEAERDLAAMQVATASAVMSIQPEDARAWVDDVRRAADGAAERPRIAATPDALAVMGIAVVEA
ncbi:hypothetical protein [Sphingomonas sp. VNH70]|uniref:hypothetical protein n=1 Tax=Sphingomonas silueang TaxID=3156617 RepID=UPI0032B56029